MILLPLLFAAINNLFSTWGFVIALGLRSTHFAFPWITSFVSRMKTLFAGGGESIMTKMPSLKLTGRLFFSADATVFHALTVSVCFAKIKRDI